MARKKTIFILKKNSKNKNLWGYAVDPSRRFLFFGTDLLGVDSGYSLEKLKKMFAESKLESFNAFMLSALKTGVAWLAEPYRENEAGCAFLYRRRPRYLWSIAEEKLISAKGMGYAPYFSYQSGNTEKYIRAVPENADVCTYNPDKKNFDGDLVWYDLSKSKKIVFKKFNGTLYANVLANSEFQKLVEEKN